MKKVRNLFLSILLLSLCALMLVGCGSDLSAPKGLTVDVDTQTLHWNMVKGAKFHTVVISGQEQAITTKSTAVSLEDLPAGTYEIKIQAKGCYPSEFAFDVKHRVLMEGNYGGHRVVYRRVKRVNELVIDGYVYDEYEALAEMAHCLTARIDVHTIEVGFDGISSSYFRVDGQMKAKKVRLF